jgi:acylphosphatase
LVRNLGDGRVKAVIEGEKEKVEKLIEWMRKGPSLARVDDLEVEWEDYKGGSESFEIRF